MLFRSVQVNVAGNYTVSGFLHNANYSLTVFNTAAAALTVGPASIRVPFSGPLINESGIDGPYIVELQLFAVDGTPVSLGSNTTTTQAYNHLAFDGAPPVPPIQSSPATTIPMIDGTISSGEWDDATRVNLTAIAGNTLPAYLLVKNNATMLYMAYDAVGDTTMTADDAASLAFETTAVSRGALPTGYVSASVAASTCRRFGPHRWTTGAGVGLVVVGTGPGPSARGPAPPLLLPPAQA